ncbi:transposase [Bradyrhizobium sp. cir1]|uniref:transposase n=1 Tax=Bradyrhizobium sp. cir1 TaxID=1445730 RepID=UPI00289CB1C4|nr:transposase [Bradyrhizobium sp. cir1]
MCNLERRQIVTLLPDREPATVQAWLAAHSTIITLDRGGGYSEAAAKALPQAIQVADRWHLMENASQAFVIPYERDRDNDLKLLTADSASRRLSPPRRTQLSCITQNMTCNVP